MTNLRFRTQKAWRITGLALLICITLSSVSVAESLRVHMILFWDAYQYMINEVVPAFERKYGVDVEFERVTWANREEKLVLGTAAGMPPDVFMNGAEHVVDLAGAGLLAPLDKYVALWNELDDFVPVTLQNSNYKGHQYGIPVYTDPRTFWYRADFFEEVGLDPDSPPANWTELMNAARRLTRTENGVVTRMGYDLTRWTGNASSAAQDFVVFLWQNGGELIDPNTFMPRFNSNAGSETMDFLRNLQETVRGHGHSVNAGTGSGSPIVRGTAAMNLNTGAVVAEAYRFGGDVPEQIRAMVPPGEKAPVTATFSNWLAIHSDSTKQDLAWEFIKFVTEAETLLRVNLLLGFISPRRSTITDFVIEQPLVQYQYETLAYARAYPVFAHTSVVAKAFDPQYRSILSGEIASQIGLNEAARLWEAVMQSGQ